MANQVENARALLRLNKAQKVVETLLLEKNIHKISTRNNDFKSIHRTVYFL